jgi:hypothetical protein
LKGADHRNGWQLKKMKEEVSALKEGSKYNVERLKTKTKYLVAEVEAVKASCKE